MSSFLAVLRFLVGALLGHFLMSLLITLVQETWLGGISYTSSPPSILALGGSLTVLCAVAGGYAAAWIAGRWPYLCGGTMSLLVAAETTWLISSGRTHDPVWFDVAAAGSLVVGLLAGCWLRARGRHGTALSVQA